MNKALTMTTDWMCSAAVHMAENNRPCLMHTSPPPPGYGMLI